MKATKTRHPKTKAEDRPGPAAPLVKILCLKCRALNDESAKFCNQCGARLAI